MPPALPEDCYPCVYGLPQKARKLNDRFGCWEAHAVVYPASKVGSVRPVPTWNLPTARQSVQTASRLRATVLPEELKASVRVGATRVAMMGDPSQRKGWEVWSRNTASPFRPQWRTRTRSSCACRRRLATRYCYHLIFSWSDLFRFSFWHRSRFTGW